MEKNIRHYLTGDRIIWGVIFTLFAASTLSVFSSTISIAFKFRDGSTFYYLLRHMFFLVFGLGIIYFVHKIPYRYFSRLAQLMLVSAAGLLVITLLLGVSRNQAARWLTIPGLGIDFQTSDFAKFALIIYVSKVLAQHQGGKNELRIAFKEIMLASIVICGLILPENFSTSAMLFGTVWLLCFVGRIPAKMLWSSVGVLIVLLVIFISVTLASPNQGRVGTWKKRIVGFVSDSEVNKDANYQSDQAKIAIVRGGMLGVGPGKSMQRNFLPNPFSDFIYAIIVEEWGFIGGAVILFLYLFLMYRSADIARRSSSAFSAFLALGLTMSLVFQALINMAVAVNIFPVTGQPLPLVSMGGTSIIFTCMAFGIILSVSRTVQPKPRVVKATASVEAVSTN